MSKQPNLNTGQTLVQTDIADLRWGIEHGQSAAQIAAFLCRTETEVRAQIMRIEPRRTLAPGWQDRSIMFLLVVMLLAMVVVYQFALAFGWKLFG